MQPSKEQIENAARLVPDYVVIDYNKDVWRDGTKFTQTWQPWADTEAGSADWAVLDTAVHKWFQNDWRSIGHTATHVNLRLAMLRHIAASCSGDLDQRKAATLDAAAAIGAHMKGVEGG